MKKIILASLFWSAFLSVSKAQNWRWLNNNWPLGASSLATDTAVQAVGLLDFRSGVPVLKKLPAADFYVNTVGDVICDSLGNLKVYTNGIQLRNDQYKVIQNGDKLPNDSQWWTTYPCIQCCLLLPIPESENKFVLFHEEIADWPAPNHPGNDGGCSNLTNSTIDMDMKNGLGKVTHRKKELIPYDMLSPGQMTACRHSNGRDWWILVPKYFNSSYYRFRFTPDGTKDMGVQTVDTLLEVGLGNAVFSPDGKWYVRYNGVGYPKANWLDIYNFDRCSGDLSNHIHHRLDSGFAVAGSVAISPNSRFLYVARYDKIFQYDLHAPDILATKTTVAENDGFVDDNNFPTPFFLMQTGPDDRIYINTSYYSSHYLHVIERPDSAGIACHVAQHSVKLPIVYTFGLPNIPFFGLGADTTSFCDTLAVGVETDFVIEKAAFTLSPNPANGGTVSLERSDLLTAVEVEILSPAGQVALRFVVAAGEKATLLDIDGLHAGVWFVSLKNQQQIFTKKLVIQR